LTRIYLDKFCLGHLIIYVAASGANCIVIYKMLITIYVFMLLGRAFDWNMRSNDFLYLSNPTFTYHCFMIWNCKYYAIIINLWITRIKISIIVKIKDEIMWVFILGLSNNPQFLLSNCNRVCTIKSMNAYLHLQFLIIFIFYNL
jgi:hypothetical protein